VRGRRGCLDLGDPLSEGGDDASGLGVCVLLAPVLVAEVVDLIGQLVDQGSPSYRSFILSLRAGVLGVVPVAVSPSFSPRSLPVAGMLATRPQAREAGT
jgi:hypothetical protein